MSALAHAARPTPDAAATGRGVVLLDPGLFFEGGHHATLARLVSDEAAARGFPARVFGARRIDRPPIGLSIRRHFRTSAYAPLSRWEPADALRVLNDEVYADARGLNLLELNDAAVIAMPTLTSRIALGLARWVAELPDWFAPRVAAVFMFQPGWTGDDRLREAELSVYREAIHLLNSATPGRVTLHAETAPIGRLFERLGATCIQELPWPVTVADGPPRLAFDARQIDPHVSLLGYSKVERGIAHMPAVIERVRQSRPDARFAVQVHAWNDPAVDRAAAELGQMGGVRTLNGAMPPAAYGERMRETDIVLLPYDPRAYRDRGSGILGEAASCGKIIVCPQQTWIADQARAWGLAAVMFDAFDPESIGDAVVEAIERRAELLSQAGNAAEAWHAERSPRAFLDRLLSPAADRPINPGSTPMTLATPPSPPTQPPAVTPNEDDQRHLVDGLWTPQTQMLRELESWIGDCDAEVGSALSIDRNPTIDDMVSRRWPGVEIERARYPEVDVQDLGVFADGSFDMTYSHQVLEHVPKPWIAAAELVRVLRPGGIGLHTTCAANPRHGPPVFNDYYRFLPDGLEQLFDGVDVLVKASWGNRQALAYNYAIDDGHGALGGRRFGRAIGEPNEENFPWHTWIIFRKR